MHLLLDYLVISRMIYAAPDLRMIPIAGDGSMNGNARKIVTAIVLAMLGWLIADQRSLRSHVRTAIATVRSDVADLRKEVHQDIAELRERVARMEGRMDTLADVFTRGDNH